MKYKEEIQAIFYTFILVLIFQILPLYLFYLKTEKDKREFYEKYELPLLKIRNKITKK